MISEEVTSEEKREFFEGFIAYVESYPRAYSDFGAFKLSTLIDDILYGIGIHLGGDKYRFANGYEKFKEDLIEFLKEDCREGVAEKRVHF